MPSDWLMGNNGLRGVCSLYDLGDFDDNGKMGDPVPLTGIY